MSIYLVNADRLHFSAKQLEAMIRLPSCGDLGGIAEGVAWVKDNDGDVIILAAEYRRDAFFKLLPRKHDSYHMDELYRAADYLMAARTECQIGPLVKLGWGVSAGRCGDGWIMCTDGDYVNQKALDVNAGKINISYKEDEQGDSN